MNIYHYLKSTNEYSGYSTADVDPAETSRQGEFVPLVPAYATLIEPPEAGEYQTPVFNKDEGIWELTADYRTTHKKVTADDNGNLTVEEIKDLGEITDGVLVTNEVAELIEQNRRKFKIENDEVVELTDEEYSNYLEEIEQERIANLSLTAADVERAIYKARSIDFDDIIETIEAMNEAGTADVDIKALKIELKANEFYRGNDYVETIGTLLGFTSDDLDYLFETGSLPESEG